MRQPENRLSRPRKRRSSPIPSNMKIELLPINSIHIFPDNARLHSRKQIEQIAKSIERCGFVNPILIDEGGLIIAGHGRLEAARQTEMHQVPVIRLSHLTDAEKRILRLADNRISENAGWNPQLLA